MLSRQAARALVLLGALGVSSLGAEPEPESKQRLLVLTDISSLTAGVAEPDDGQSLIRLLLYADAFEIEGLIASANLKHGRVVRPDLIVEAIDAYEQVRPNLLLHDPDYPPAELLRSRIKAGQPLAGPDVPADDCLGPDRDTEASRWIIEVADRPDPRPIRVLIWGGSADLAQALWRVRHDRGAEGLDRFAARLRVFAIGDQDATGPWIKRNVPALPYITAERAYRGMYRGGDVSLVSSDWVRSQIHGHGALGDLYPDYKGGDIFAKTLGPVRGIKEGDSPSFLGLIPNGLNVPDQPDLGGWGGRYRIEGNRGVDIPDPDLETANDPDPRMATVYRWRPAFQADFEARLDWCVRSFDEANHPPLIVLDGESRRSVAPGEFVSLDAGGSSDPDGDDLSYEWRVYPPDGAEDVVIEDQYRSAARVRVPAGSAGRAIPLLVTVIDDGQPRLTRHGRVYLDVQVGPGTDRR